MTSLFNNRNVFPILKFSSTKAFWDCYNVFDDWCISFYGTDIGKTKCSILFQNHSLHLSVFSVYLRIHSFIMILIFLYEKQYTEHL